MKFSVRQDVEASIEDVNAAVTDFPRFERQARRRGVKLWRLDQLEGQQVGMRWAAQFRFRGKPRRLQAELTALEEYHCVAMKSVSGGVAADFDIEMIELSPGRTRLKVGLELLPRTLPARLLIQSLKFAKGNLDRRFADRIAAFAQDIERRSNPPTTISP